MMSDRRIRRSEVPAEAARLYLDATADRHGYQALTLADADGLVVVDAPRSISSEAVAAIAPFVQGEAVRDDGLLEMVTRGEALRVRTFEMEGQPMFLAAVGGQAQPPAEAEAAMRRILGPRSVVA